MVGLLMTLGWWIEGAHDECRAAATLVDASGVERVRPDLLRVCVLARDGADASALATMGCTRDAVWHDESGFARVDRREVRACMTGFGFVADARAPTGWRSAPTAAPELRAPSDAVASVGP